MAAEVNYTLDQGATFTQVVTSSFSLTGYTASMELRADPASPAYLLQLTSSSGLTLSGTSLTITITPSQTLYLPAGATVAYDLLVTSGGVTTTLQRGYIFVYPLISR